MSIHAWSSNDVHDISWSNSGIFIPRLPQVSWFSCNRRVDLLKSPCPSMVFWETHILVACWRRPAIAPGSQTLEPGSWTNGDAWRCNDLSPRKLLLLVLKCIECVPKAYWLMTEDSWSEPRAWTPPIRFQGPLFSRRSCPHSNGHKRWGKPQRSCVEDPWTTCGIQV